MSEPLGYLEGAKMCVVFVTVVDESAGKVKLQCFRGRADVNRGKVTVINEDGAVFPVPSSAIGNIMPNDGTQILKDADYFVLVRTDEGIELSSSS